jgi:hypothetical protein
MHDLHDLFYPTTELISVSTTEVNPFLSSVRSNMSEQIAGQVSNIILENPDVANQAVDFLSNNNPFLY